MNYWELANIYVILTHNSKNFPVYSGWGFPADRDDEYEVTGSSNII